MATFEGITSVPTILHGKPTIRGMRLTVRRVMEALAVCPEWDDLRREYPELEPGDIRQTLAFAAWNRTKACSRAKPCETPAARTCRITGMQCSAPNYRAPEGIGGDHDNPGI